ncbi:uncharacterized protein LOC143854131 isoform X2 [Tasmannia lanceolata]|uniref:uncharacterized protein LOC143854131 isoform X2 n=1 Tax=Tasmannia lanceolata TaxID=3420 RepID=UPI0040637C2C
MIELRLRLAQGFLRRATHLLLTEFFVNYRGLWSLDQVTYVHSRLATFVTDKVHEFYFQRENSIFKIKIWFTDNHKIRTWPLILL